MTSARRGGSRSSVFAVGTALAIACGAATFAQPTPAFAQGKSVSSLIQRGAELFDDQQYEESIQTLSAALVRPGTTKAEKIEIYRLLAYNYIILKRTEEADAAVRGLLVLDETFTLAPNESPRFRDFFAATRKKWEAEGKPGKVEEGRPPAPEKPVEIRHNSPPQVEANTTIKLTGTLDDPGNRVRGVELAYRAGSTGKFVTVAATYTMGSFRAQIPASSVKPPLVEYYLQALDKGGLPVSGRGDAAAPLRIVVPAPAQSKSVFASPFFWVPVGAVVVAGAVVTAIIVSRANQTSHVTVNVGE